MLNDLGLKLKSISDAKGHNNTEDEENILEFDEGEEHSYQRNDHVRKGASHSKKADEPCVIGMNMLEEIAFARHFDDARSYACDEKDRSPDDEVLSDDEGYEHSSA